MGLQDYEPDDNVYFERVHHDFQTLVEVRLTIVYSLLVADVLVKACRQDWGGVDIPQIYRG